MPLLIAAGLGSVEVSGKAPAFGLVTSSSGFFPLKPIQLLSAHYLKYASLKTVTTMDQDKDLTHRDDGGDAATIVQDAIPKVAEPPRYAVFLHNDDYTTMEFVVEVLTMDFSRSHEEAMGLMLKVHEEGKAVAGIYSLEIAESKVLKVTEKARRSGFPLKLTMEPVGAKS